MLKRFCSSLHGISEMVRTSNVLVYNSTLSQILSHGTTSSKEWKKRWTTLWTSIKSSIWNTIFQFKPQTEIPWMARESNVIQIRERFSRTHLNHWVLIMAIFLTSHQVELISSFGWTFQVWEKIQIKLSKTFLFKLSMWSTMGIVYFIILLEIKKLFRRFTRSTCKSKKTEI